MANVSVSNTTGLYIGSGAAPILNNAQQLISLLSNNGGVTFSLDPAYGNSRVEAFGPNINANIAAYLPTYTGNLVSLQGDVITTANVQATNFVTNGQAGNITGVNYITANFFVGNGSLLTGITSTYGNANVASYLPTYTGNLVSLAGNVITSANVTGAYILGNGSQLTGLPATYSNTNVASYLASNSAVTILTTANITTSANVRGAYILGDGSQLANLPSGNYSNVNVASYLSSNSAVTILTTANITTAANVQGAYILGNAAFLTGIPTGNYSNVNVAAYLPTYTGNLVSLAGNVITSANVKAAYFIGNGSTLTSITGANVTGTVPLATTSTYVTGLTGTNVNVALGYVPLNSNSAAVSAGLATYVTGNAQANITSVGTLSSLTVTGNITSSAGNVSGLYILGNGSQLTGISAGSTYSNTNVASYLPTYSGNVGSMTGNLGVIGGNVIFGQDTNGFLSSNITVPGLSTILTGPTKIAAFSNGIGAASGSASISAAMFLTANVVLNRDNNSSNYRVRTTQWTNTFDSNGYQSTLGVLPYTVGNATTMTREPGYFINSYLHNSQGSTTVSNITSFAGLTNLVGVNETTQNINLSYGVGNYVAFFVSDATNTSTISNATAFRADFISATSNAAQIGNRIAFESPDPTANIKIAGNLVSTAANVVAVGGTYSGNITATNIDLQGNLTTNPANATVFGNLTTLYGNTYIGSDATLFASTTTATGSAGLAGQAPIRFGGQYTVTGNASVQMGTMMIANLALGRPNTNNSARVRVNYVGGVFDANGYASTIGISPFSDGGSQTNLITGITRAPQNTISLAPWNSQGPSGNAVTISSIVTQSSLASFGQTSANITCTYAVAINGVVSVSANTNQVTNATAFRADFVQTQSNAAVIGNRLVLECIDTTANIKIAGNIVSTTGAVVAPNVTLKGYTETIDSTAPTGGTFAPNVSNATIYSGTLTSSLTFNGFTNPVAGQSATVIITQGGSGSYTLTSTMKFAGGSKTLSTAVGVTDIISVFYDGSNYWASLTTGYA